MAINSIRFGINLLKFWVGRDKDQLHTREIYHNQPYNGKKIPLIVTFFLTFLCNFKSAHCTSDIDNTKVSHDSSI